MAIKLTALGSGNGSDKRVIGRVTRSVIAEPQHHVLVIDSAADATQIEIAKYAALLCGDRLPPDIKHNPAICAIDALGDTTFLSDGQVALADPSNGFVRSLYRPGSRANTIFMTEQCDNNCLMCSQPPKDWDDSHLVAENLRLVDLIPDNPVGIGITGGEPTLIPNGLEQILTRLRDRLSSTRVHMLTNGRRYHDAAYAKAIADIRHPNFVSGIPLYGDVADIHDYVVQSIGAFDQTVEGIYNAYESGLRVEVRIVLHKQTIERLGKFADFIYRHLPFVEHVALMGLENMGYVRKNWNDLWIDPADYQVELEAAVRGFYHRRLVVSVYNLPLCVVPRSIWEFARQSISDFKNIYLEVCSDCAVRDHCTGLFASGEKRHSRAIAPIRQ
ncbi:MAG TPA: His-Xaa-Ser system radical SAM maturase HxsC [Terriglobales bacterium]